MSTLPVWPLRALVLELPVNGAAGSEAMKSRKVISLVLIARVPPKFYRVPENTVAV